MLQQKQKNFKNYKTLLNYVGLSIARLGVVRLRFPDANELSSAVRARCLGTLYLGAGTL
jgi:hypothetical protein